MKGKRRGQAKKPNAEASLMHENLFPKLPHPKRNLQLPFIKDKLPKQLKKTKNNIKMAKGDSKSVDTVLLKNGMKVLLVQDPKATDCAVALSVNVGSFSDPEEVKICSFLTMEGLAHLSEHMVFLGEKKDEQGNVLSGRFDEFVSKLGGLYPCFLPLILRRNAYTSTEETNYHYSFPFPKGYDMLERSLDLFSNSFVSPHFSEEGIEKESKVVDNEYSKNVGDPFRSLYELLRATSSEKHPFRKFACGNFHTLNVVPKERNYNVSELLNNFFKTHYTAERMKAVIYSNIKTERLKSLAEAYFTRILPRPKEEPSRKLIFKGTAFTPLESGRKFHVVSNHDKCEIMMVFPLQGDRVLDYKRNIPALFLSHVLGSGQEGSLVDYLEQKEWGKSVAGQTMPAYDGLNLFFITISCTEKAIWDNVDDIVHATFQYLSFIYKKKLPQELIDHVAEEFDRHWLQNEDIKAAGSAFNFVSSIVSTMHQTSEENYFTYGDLVESFDDDVFMSLLECLVPTNLTLFIHHTGAEAEADLEEDRLKAKYGVEAIPQETIENWGKRKQLFDEEGEKFVFKLPKVEKRKDPKNLIPFTPSKVDLQHGLHRMENIPLNLKKRVNKKHYRMLFDMFIYLNKPKEKDITQKSEPIEDDKTVVIRSGTRKAVKADPKQNVKPVRKAQKPSVLTQFTGGLNTNVHSLTVNTNLSPFGNVASFRQVQNKYDDFQNNEGNCDFNAVNDLAVKVREDEKEDNDKEKVGKLFTFNSAKEIPSNSADQFRPPVLLKATERSLLFFKRSKWESYPDEQFRTYVTFIINLPFLYTQSTVYSTSSNLRDSIIFSFYLDFLHTSLRKYLKKQKLDHNVYISLYSSKGLAIEMFGYAVDLFSAAKTIIEEIKRLHSDHPIFKASRFQRLKNARLRAFKHIKKKPLKIVDDLLSTLCFEPAYDYKYREKVLKSIKLRDVQLFANPYNIFRNRNTQCLVFGNADKDFALKLYESMEKALHSNKNLYSEPIPSKFPRQNCISLKENSEQMYIVKSVDSLQTDSAFHCDMQVDFNDFENEYFARACVALIGGLIETPCHDFIRTKHVVGYLVHTRESYGGLSGGIEFMFQSNKFSPSEMDEKFELFIEYFLEVLPEFTDKEFLAAKMSIAERKFKKKRVVSEEMNSWVGKISACNYDFDRMHKVVNELFKLSMEDVVKFYTTYFCRKKESKRRKLLVGLTSIQHFEQEEQKYKALEEQGKLDNVKIIKDPYTFRFSQKLQYLS
eukprot:maker-scaffold_41-snap-gene-2.35-mRNA-1 protein AED:0.43 eAED:0.45 QI:0/0/0/0.75/0.66/0.75/4/0/1250